MTKTNRLTNGIIDSTKTTGSDQWLSDDDGNRGWGRLLLRIGPNGDRRFYFRYSIQGIRTTMPLGQYARKASPGKLTLAQARKIAIQYSALHRSPATRDVKALIEGNKAGSFPEQGAKPAERRRSPTSSECNDSLLALCNAYTAALEKRDAQSARSTKNYIKNHVAPTEWAGVPAREVSSKDVTALLRRVIEAGKGSTANKVRQTLHAAYGMALQSSLDPMIPTGMEDFGIEFNPVSATRSLSGLSKPGERALDRVELGYFWATINEKRFDAEMPIRFVRLSILLGGQRALQLLRCPVASVDIESGHLTLLDGMGRRSTPRHHCLPISPAAKPEVEWLVTHSKNLGNSYLFAGRLVGQHLSDSPISRAVARISKELVASGTFKLPFGYTDLRRTIETNMAALKITKDIRAQIQSHGLGGVQNKHYDRWDYFEQKQEALALWATYLDECAKASKKVVQQQAHSTSA